VWCGRWRGRERGRGREWSEGKRVTDGILGLIWDFSSSGPAVWQSSLAPLRFEWVPADMDQGPDQGGIKVATCVFSRDPRPDPGQGGHVVNLRCTVQYYYSIQYSTVRSVLVARANGEPGGVPSKQGRRGAGEQGSRGAGEQGE
jgi:hypothetical protein